MTTKNGLGLGMKWVLAGMLIAQPVCAEPYVELGAFYTKDRIWIDSGDGIIEESGVRGHIAAGYEIEYENLVFDVQARHESDPKQSGEDDLTYKKSVGTSLRYRF